MVVIRSEIFTLEGIGLFAFWRNLEEWFFEFWLFVSGYFKLEIIARIYNLAVQNKRDRLGNEYFLHNFYTKIESEFRFTL